jgi:hypothetical protein
MRDLRNEQADVEEGAEVVELRIRQIIICDES